ncbi:unnamed protein product [Clonostachys rosea]|uniref:F-box domain-containing protein n=1 Tax=Bionectria ochroleuca TaxID=29856 RepID=A0ABY6U483_BIOOC|nr:unnamed protein product [Clonostachys rosea]
MADASASSAIQQLPHELIHHVLTLCPDPATLSSLARSCSAFYAAFAARPAKIITAVLSRSIHPSVQRDAYIAVAASRLDPDDPAGFDQFLDETLCPKPAPRVPWTLRHAADAMRFHNHVEYLAQALTQQILQAEPFTEPAYGHSNDDGDSAAPASPPSPPPPATTSEVNRFQRALYRLQTFCELLNRESSYEEVCKVKGFATSPDVWLACYAEFATYEIEQLSCLNDLLMALVAQMLHDVTWGHLGVRLITSASSRLGQEVMSRGLETLHALHEATSYDEAREILHLGETRHDRPVERRNFLIDRFDDLDGRQYLGHIGVFDDLPPEVKAKLIRKPFYPDPDLGPGRVWERVHLSEGIPIGLVAVHQFRHYRRWGYVFWDEERLDKLGAFDERWDDDASCPAAPEDPFLVYWEIHPEEMAASQALRSKIWKRGGRGYWDHDDESQVVYPARDA